MKNKGFTPALIAIRHKMNTQLVRGFTLIEILVSLFILAVGLIVLLDLFPLGLQALSYSRKIGEVSLLAQKKLEELKSQGIIEIGQKSGKEGDLNWQMNIRPLKLGEGIEVASAQLDIDFDFQGKPLKQRFITYLIGD